MFPKSNILHDPFSYTSQDFLKQSCNTHDHHQNPNSTSTIVVVEEEKDDPFFLNFPSPFLDDHELPLSQIFSQKLEDNDNHDTTNQADPDNTVKDNHSVDNSRSTRLNMKIMGDQSSNPTTNELATSSSKKRKLISTKPRRRTGKKDRHSKICTAQGVRDRRMRLSLQIARKFFDLQDMLGFDKASNTIEWLFSKSKNAIKELSRNIPQENNSSDHQNNNDDHRKLRKIGSSDKPIRAKARDQTKEKMTIKKGNQELDETNPISNMDKLGSNSKSLENQFANVGIMERYLGGASYSSITSIFDFDNNGVIKEGKDDIYDNCFAMGILENCSTTNEVQIPFAGNNPSSIYLDNSRFHQFLILEQENHFLCRH